MVGIREVPDGVPSAVVTRLFRNATRLGLLRGCWMMLTAIRVVAATVVRDWLMRGTGRSVPASTSTRA